MTDESNEIPPKPQKASINQNLVIAIIGAVATVLAAVVPWALDRASKAEPTPMVVQATFTVAAPVEATATVQAAATNTEVPASPTSEPTITATPTQETGIFNTYMAIDFEGKLPDISFKTGQPIYVFFNLNDPLGKNIVRVIVSAEDVRGVLADSQFYNTINEYKDPNIRLIVSQGGLKPGKYKVEFILNNTLDETLEFTVTE